MENMIRNCAVTFRRVCPRTWESLRSTEEASIRFCASCQREVFLCMVDDETVLLRSRRHRRRTLHHFEMTSEDAAYGAADRSQGVSS